MKLRPRIPATVITGFLGAGKTSLLRHLVSHARGRRIALVINTPSGKGARTDEGAIRAAAVAHGVTCITTLAAAYAAVEACRAMKNHQLTVSALQDHYPVRK